MRLGLISDIHGNLIALEAVVGDGRAQEVDEWWVLGDLAALGPDPLPTLERLTSLPNVRFVRGNTDRYVVTGARPRPTRDEVARDPALQPLFDEVEASFSWTRDALTNEWLRFLADLPDEQRVELPDGTRLLGIHASPNSDDGPGIRPDAPEVELAELLARAYADVVCGGHTHRPTDRLVGPMRAINLGSVSNPVTSDRRATYVVISADRDGHRVEHRRVGYDHEAVIERVFATGHPAAEFIAGFQGVNKP